jgi:hypothetical protein
MAEIVDGLLVGIKRWHAGVMHEPATGRWVTLTLEYVDKAEMPPIVTALSPDDARRVGEALRHYALQAETRDSSEMN